MLGAVSHHDLENASSAEDGGSLGAELLILLLEQLGSPVP